MQDRFKFRVWRPDKNCYADDVSWRDDDVVYDYFLDNSGQLCAGVGDKSIDTFDVEKCQNGEIVEMCTGLKDKNGNLIYENDRIKARNATGIVRFGFYRYTGEHFPDSIYGFYIDWAGNCAFRQDFGYWATEEIEIIGNIHTTEKE